MADQKKRQREWDYSPVPDGEEFTDKHGHVVLGWHPRSKGQDAGALLAEFQAYHDHLWAGQRIVPLLMRPILVREMSEVECRIEGCEEGTFTRCTERAKNPRPMWQIEIDPDPGVKAITGELPMTVERFVSKEPMKSWSAGPWVRSSDYDDLAAAHEMLTQAVEFTLTAVPASRVPEFEQLRDSLRHLSLSTDPNEPSSSDERKC